MRKLKRYNSHSFQRSVQCYLSNKLPLFPGDPATFCVSNDANLLATPATLAGSTSPYGSSGNFTVATRFALDKVPNAGEFTTLYDQYKISGVKIKFEYAHNDAAADATAVPLPTLVAIRDYDDTAVLTHNEIMERTVIAYKKRLDKPVTMFLKPRVKRYIEAATGTSTPSAVFAREWIDVGAPSVLHYGLKLAIYDWPCQNTVGDIGQNPVVYTSRPILRVTYTYYFKFRNVR